jgi:catechol 2,3-dioxygenase-like lactoylglutathione lyase family enzyme
MDFKLELIVLPVADVDKVKTFYIDNAGFHLDVDHQAGDFRVVQLTPPGSACSITLMPSAVSPGNGAPGSVQGLHLIVSDIDAARAELAGRGVDVSDNSFLSFSDPEGNGWLVQEVTRPEPTD